MATSEAKVMWTISVADAVVVPVATAEIVADMFMVSISICQKLWTLWWPWSGYWSPSSLTML